MSGEITVDDLKPDTLVRISLQASGPIHRSFCMRIIEAGPLRPDNQIRLYGHRLTYRWRPVERMTITVPLVDLHPVVPGWSR